MKIQGAEREIVSNVDNSHKFSIQNNAKMFEILSSRIYTYKPTAIVREISCNAYDAHIEAGKADVPFRVVLPNDMHPYFEVEDYGVGLDDVGVKEIYTQYGNSTKANSNEVIGAFGLGSKTPFAYTNSFTIQTRKDGREYLFNAYLGQGGEPTISLARERDTDECNGVKIKVPIKPNDYHVFYSEAAFILSFFPVRPEVIAGNVFDFNFDLENISNISGDKLTTLNTSFVNSSLYRGEKIFAVMGSVCYLVNRNDLHLPKDEDSYLQIIVLRNHSNSVFVKFDIGELDVTASREALSIEEGKATSKVLSSRFTECIRNSIEKDKEAIATFDHPTDAIKYITDKYGDIIKLVGQAFMYKGKSLYEWSMRDVAPFYLKSFGGIVKNSRSSYRRAHPRSRYSITLNSMIRHKFIIVYPKNEKIKSLELRAKRIAKRYSDINIIWFKRPVSEHTIDRLLSISSLKPEVTCTFEEIQEIERAERKANRPVNNNVSTRTQLDKKKNTEIYARGFVIKPDNSYYFSSQRTDIDDCDYDYYYAEAASNYSPRTHIKIDNSTNKHFHPNEFKIISHLINKPIKVLISNNVNEKSIKKNNVEHISKLLEDVAEHKEHFKKAYIINNVMNYSFVNHSTSLNTRYWAVSIALHAKVVEVDIIKDCLKYAKNNNKIAELIDSGACDNIISYILSDDMEPLLKTIDELYIVNDTLINLYPMLSLVNEYTIPLASSNDSSFNKCVEYIKAVNKASQINS